MDSPPTVQGNEQIIWHHEGKVIMVVAEQKTILNKIKMLTYFMLEVRKFEYTHCLQGEIQNQVVF